MGKMSQKPVILKSDITTKSGYNGYGEVGLTFFLRLLMGFTSKP